MASERPPLPSQRNTYLEPEPDFRMLVNSRLLLESKPPTEAGLRGIASETETGDSNSFFWAGLGVQVKADTDPDRIQYVKRECRRGHISWEDIFMIGFPSASREEKEREGEYVKLIDPDCNVGNVNTWISPETALKLADEYSVSTYIEALLHPQSIKQPKQPNGSEIPNPPVFKSATYLINEASDNSKSRKKHTGPKRKTTPRRPKARGRRGTPRAPPGEIQLSPPPSQPAESVDGDGGEKAEKLDETAPDMPEGKTGRSTAGKIVGQENQEKTVTTTIKADQVATQADDVKTTATTTTTVEELPCKVNGATKAGLQDETATEEVKIETATDDSVEKIGSQKAETPSAADAVVERSTTTVETDAAIVNEDKAKSPVSIVDVKRTTTSQDEIDTESISVMVDVGLNKLAPISPGDTVEVARRMVAAETKPGVKNTARKRKAEEPLLPDDHDNGSDTELPVSKRGKNDETQDQEPKKEGKHDKMPGKELEKDEKGDKGKRMTWKSLAVAFTFQLSGLVLWKIQG